MKVIRCQVWLHVDLLHWSVVDQSKSGTSKCSVSFRCSSKIAKRDCYFHFRPLARMENLGFHLKYFHVILYFIIFPKSVEKIQVSLKSDKNEMFYTCRPKHTYHNIHSFSILSDDRSNDSSKTIPPHSAI